MRQYNNNNIQENDAISSYPLLQLAKRSITVDIEKHSELGRHRRAVGV